MLIYLFPYVDDYLPIETYLEQFEMKINIIWVRRGEESKRVTEHWKCTKNVSKFPFSLDQQLSCHTWTWVAVVNNIVAATAVKVLSSKNGHRPQVSDRHASFIKGEKNDKKMSWDVQSEMRQNVFIEND